MPNSGLTDRELSKILRTDDGFLILFMAYIKAEVIQAGA